MTPSQFAHEKLQLALWGCGIGFALLFFMGSCPCRVSSPHHHPSCPAPN